MDRLVHVRNEAADLARALHVGVSLMTRKKLMFFSLAPRPISGIWNLIFVDLNRKGVGFCVVVYATTLLRWT